VTVVQALISGVFARSFGQTSGFRYPLLRKDLEATTAGQRDRARMKIFQQKSLTFHSVNRSVLSVFGGHLFQHFVRWSHLSDLRVFYIEEEGTRQRGTRLL
jgi:hypothetical protein